jgi:hypothetical protein
MKTNRYYNFNGYLNTASLLRERVLSDEYMIKSINTYKKGVHLRQQTINEFDRKNSNTISLKSKPSPSSYVRTLPSIEQHHSTDSLSILYSLRDDKNKKLFSGFNYNEKFDEFLKRRKVVNKSLDKSICNENEKLMERIKRIHSALSKDNMIKEYNTVSKPVLKRIKKVYPNDLMSLKIQNMQKKVKMLNLK